MSKFIKIEEIFTLGPTRDFFLLKEDHGDKEKKGFVFVFSFIFFFLVYFLGILIWQSLFYFLFPWRGHKIGKLNHWNKNMKMSIVNILLGMFWHDLYHFASWRLLSNNKYKTKLKLSYYKRWLELNMVIDGYFSLTK